MDSGLIERNRFEDSRIHLVGSCKLVGSRVTLNEQGIQPTEEDPDLGTGQDPKSDSVEE